MILCNHCHRHYRSNEIHCPFCGTTRAELTRRLGLGLAVALGVASSFGCGGESNGAIRANGRDLVHDIDWRLNQCR